MEHVPSPALGKTGDLRQLVGDPAGEDQPARGETFSVGGLHHETVRLLLRRDGGFGQPLDAGIGQQLRAGVIGDGRRIAAVLAEKAVEAWAKRLRRSPVSITSTLRRARASCMPAEMPA